MTACSSLTRSRPNVPNQTPQTLTPNKPTCIQTNGHHRLYTINLHKRLHKITFKNRAPRAIREIKKFAEKNMGTK
jgi:hypothetical protein